LRTVLGRSHRQANGIYRRSQRGFGGSHEHRERRAVCGNHGEQRIKSEVRLQRLEWFAFSRRCLGYAIFTVKVNAFEVLRCRFFNLFHHFSIERSMTEDPSRPGALSITVRMTKSFDRLLSRAATNRDMTPEALAQLILREWLLAEGGFTERNDPSMMARSKKVPDRSFAV
jgi:hypothetical protein